MEIMAKSNSIVLAPTTERKTLGSAEYNRQDAMLFSSSCLSSNESLSFKVSLPSPSPGTVRNISPLLSARANLSPADPPPHAPIPRKYQKRLGPRVPKAVAGARGEERGNIPQGKGQARAAGGMPLVWEALAERTVQRYLEEEQVLPGIQVGVSSEGEVLLHVADGQMSMGKAVNLLSGTDGMHSAWGEEKRNHNLDAFSKLADQYHLEQNLMAQVTYQLQGLGLSEDDITRVMGQVPSLHRSHFKESNVGKLEILRSYGLSEQEVRNTVKRCPQFLLKSSSVLVAVFEYLLKDIGVKKERLGHVVSTSNFLALHLETNLTPKVEFLRKLGLGDVAVLVVRYPRLLAGSLETMEFNKSTLQALVGGEAARAMIWKQPGLLVVCPETITTSALRLREVGTEAQVRELLVGYPHVLTLRWNENVKLTLDYLCSRCGFSPLDALRAKVVHRSLARVIRPRVEFCLARGICIMPLSHLKIRGDLKNRKSVFLSTLLNLPSTTISKYFPEFSPADYAVE